MFLTEVQIAVARYLGEHEFFAQDPAILVVAQNDKELLAKMQHAVGSLGIVVLVAPLGGDYGQTETNGAYFAPAKFTCRVRENIPINRATTGTGQPADYVAEVCAQLLKHYIPLSSEGVKLSGSAVRVTGINPGDDDKGIFAMDTLFQIDGGLSHEPVRREFTNPNNP